MQKTRYNNIFKYTAIIFVGLLLIFIVVIINLLNGGEKIIDYASSALGTKSLCQNCNVVMVSLDTLSANHLSCLGYYRDTSPNLCEYAKNNVFFSNAYTNASWTLPSHVSVFTGLYDYHNGKYLNGNPLDSKVQLFPEKLKNLGYNVLFFTPFDDPAMPVDEIYGRLNDSLFDNNQYDWSTSIKMFKDSVSSGKKTFMFLHTYEVHVPYIIGEAQQTYPPNNKTFPVTWEQFNKPFTYDKKFVDKVISDAKIGVDAKWTWKQNKEKSSVYLRELIDAEPDYEKEVSVLKDMESVGLLGEYVNEQKYTSLVKSAYDVDTLRALYDQKINQLDSNNLKLILDLINDKNYAENTVLVIFSDHGEEFMEHGHMWHETVYNSNLRVPIIMHLPNIKNINVTSAVQLTDIVPTIEGVLGIKSNVKYDGVSLLSKILLNSKSRELIVSDSLNLQDKSIIYWPWKLFMSKNSNGAYTPYGLYNLANDPNESNNVLFSEQGTVRKIISRPSLSDLVVDWP